MAILKKVKMICDTCQGNGYIRVATGDTSIDFRDNSQVQQCWECDSEGEFYETIEVDNISNDANGSDSIH
jgi:DnaJ-class molecular chaperone